MLMIGMTSSDINAQCWSVGNGTNGGVFCMYPDSLHDCLYIGGGFDHTGLDTLNHCGIWNDTTFNLMGMGGVGTNDSVWCFVMFEGDLYVGGTFTQAGGIAANHIARWDGTAWYPVGAGFNAPVYALCIYNNMLFAGGSFTASGSIPAGHLAQWNGTAWSQVGDGTDGPVYSLAVCFEYMFLGGNFGQAGGIAADNICYWNGAGFGVPGEGITMTGMMGHHGSVYALCTYQGTLYCGGQFNHAGGNWMQNLAMWDGNNWSSVGNIGGGMMSDMASAMCVYDGQLYVGGNFGSCNGQASNNIGVWNGSDWSTIGTGMNGTVRSLAVYHDKLYIAGAFDNANGVPVNNIASYAAATGIQQVDPEVIELSVFPNPASGVFKCQWTQSQTLSVSIEVQDLMGRTLLLENLGILAQGAHSKEVSAQNLDNGIYLVTIHSGDTRTTVKLSAGALVAT